MIDDVELKRERGTRGQAEQNIPVSQYEHMTDYLFNQTHDLLRDRFKQKCGDRHSRCSTFRTCLQEVPQSIYTERLSGCRRSTEIQTE